MCSHHCVVVNLQHSLTSFWQLADWKKILLEIIKSLIAFTDPHPANILTVSYGCWGKMALICWRHRFVLLPSRGEIMADLYERLRVTSEAAYCPRYWDEYHHDVWADNYDRGMLLDGKLWTFLFFTLRLISCTLFIIH